MPIVTNLSSIPSTPVDTLLSAVQGKITKIYKPKSGSNDRGHWSFQKIKLRDKTGESWVNLRNRSTLEPAWEGHWVLFEEEGDDGKIRVDHYNGENRIEVNTTAAMTEREIDTQAASAPTTPPAANPPTPSQSAPTPPCQTPTPSPAQSQSPDFVLARTANAWVRCIEAAARVADLTFQRMKRPDPVVLSQEEILKIATSMFIKLDKEGRIEDFPMSLPDPKHGHKNDAPDPSRTVQPANPTPAPEPPPQPQAAAQSDPLDVNPEDDDTDDIPF